MISFTKEELLNIQQSHPYNILAIFTNVESFVEILFKKALALYAAWRRC